MCIHSEFLWMLLGFDLFFFLYYLAGILYKGNGENQFISQQPPVVSSIMGNGRRRSISCPSCNGQADGNKLLAPVALACGIDGSLYVGDFNYVRRIFPSGNVTSVLELRYVFFSSWTFGGMSCCGKLKYWISFCNFVSLSLQMLLGTKQNWVKRFLKYLKLKWKYFILIKYFNYAYLNVRI